MSKLTARLLLNYWLPVALMVAVIVVESTDFFSANETGGLLRPVLNWISVTLAGHALSEERFLLIHAVLRKLGHFIGYALLCLVSFRALRGTARAERSLLAYDWEWFWSKRWASLAFASTVIVAASDEFHQVFLPSRTGTFHDVVIDCAGGAMALLVTYAVSRAQHARSARSLMKV
ncbi:MAG TPA: VanZ family protein [Clostridia bacterium]|nr:VanZ family protein [Clostridia bacterium]